MDSYHIMHLQPGDLIFCQTLGPCELLMKRSQEDELNLLVRDASGELWQFNGNFVSGKVPTTPPNFPNFRKNTLDSN
jgi:hypothetical protein